MPTDQGQPSNPDSVEAVTGPPKSLSIVCVLFFLGLAFVQVTRPAVTDPDHFLKLNASGIVRIQDFASHLTFAKSYWQGQGDYSPAGHLRMTSDWAGQPIEHALPFGYSPTMLAVLAPICPLPLQAAYVVWTMLGVAVIGWMLWKVNTAPSANVHDIRALGDSVESTGFGGWLRFVWMAAAAIVLVGPLGFKCLAHGQTAVFTTAAIFYLAWLSPDAGSNQTAARGASWRSDLFVAVVLWLLTAKPPLAITGGFGLLACRRFRAIGIALVITGVSTFLLGQRFAGGWIEDYLALFGSYNLSEIDSAYAWSIHPEQMANLRGLLHTTLGVSDAVACKVSSGMWLVALVAIVGARWLGKIRVAQVWSLVVLAYLLYCPHVSFTELTHLVIPLALLSRGRFGLPAALRWGATLLICGMMFVPVDWTQRQLLLLGLEVGLLIILVLGSPRSDATVASAEVVG